MPATDLKYTESEYSTYYPSWINSAKPTTTTPQTSTSPIKQQVSEDVVISGVSGRFAESINVDQFASKLYNGLDEYTSLKRKTIDAEFDAKFFGVESRKIDLQSRYLIEATYDAVFDAGFSRAELQGSRTHFFMGTQDLETRNRFVKSMGAELLKQVFAFKGEMEIFDSQSYSGLVALDAALRAIEAGKCDYAVVLGVDMIQENLSVGAVFVQRRRDCRRFYAKLLDSRVYYGDRKVVSPNNMNATMIKEVYTEAKISPALVTYVENYGSKAGYAGELNKLVEVFGVERTLPLFVASSQYGREIYQKMSGIFALIKMIVVIQRGVIPADFYQPELAQITDMLSKASVQLVKANTKFCGGLMALNSFDASGTYSHILIQPNSDYLMGKLGKNLYWNQDLTTVSGMPRVFEFSARTERGVEKVMEEVNKYPMDMRTQFMLNANINTDIESHPFRGFTILNSDKTIQQIQEVKDTKRPIFYVFSGLGAEWENICQDMMKIEAFNQSMLRIAAYLKPYNFDLIQLITSGVSKTRSTVDMFVAITAIQIALVDCLRAAGIEADGLIGHSIGELACGYADNSLTAEETILIAYFRGKHVDDAHLPAGQMATIGLTWEQAQQKCPSGVVPAFHNHDENVSLIINMLYKF